jgi:hypothetical protein
VPGDGKGVDARVERGSGPVEAARQPVPEGKCAWITGPAASRAATFFRTVTAEVAKLFGEIDHIASTFVSKPKRKES